MSGSRLCVCVCMCVCVYVCVCVYTAHNGRLHLQSYVNNDCLHFHYPMDQHKHVSQSATDKQISSSDVADWLTPVAVCRTLVQCDGNLNKY